MADRYTPQDLQDNLNYLNETKKHIRQALIDAGQHVKDTDTFRSYADKIREMSSITEQHMPFYFIEQEDDGTLSVVNNYDEIKYVPYELDDDGNFIVLQDNNDTATYKITENNELEVTI